MTTPTHVEPVAGASPSMTPERWRAVDAIVQLALTCAPGDRESIVADACEGDDSLRAEVASLLAAHRDTSQFLEAPAAVLHATAHLAERPVLAKPPLDPLPRVSAFDGAYGAPLAAPQPSGRPEPFRAYDVPSVPGGRSVSARASMYFAAAMLSLGLVGGLLLGRSSRFSPRSEVQAVPAGNVALAVVDRTGRMVREIPAERPWTPRFSPDGHRVAYGAFGSGRTTSDLWITDLDAGTTRRITDDEGDANDPQWSADGASIAYSITANGGKDVVVRRIDDGTVRVIPRNGTQFPSDWVRDGSALLVTEETDNAKGNILAQPADGTEARSLAATGADETAARVSPDGRWVAYTSDASGKPEVYLDSYAQPGRQRVKVSLGGGVHPVWRGDGRELYYWRDGSLVAVRMAASVDGAMPVSGAQSVLFRAPYNVGLNTMYDVSPDGQRFVIARQKP